jgi:hydroxyacylglutathione hydrolase
MIFQLILLITALYLPIISQYLGVYIDMKSWTTKKGTQIYQTSGGRSNTFLISYNNNNILIDTGTKVSWHKLSKKLDDYISTNDSLTCLILTHVHFDHAGNSARIREKYNTKLIVHESEANFLASGINSATRGALPVTKFFYNLIGGEKLLRKIKFKSSDYDITVQDKYDLKKFGLDAYIIHTPGHSIGSVSIIIDNEIAVVGDTMFGVFKGSVFPPWALDSPLMINSWKKLLDTGCTIFLPGHGTGNSRKLLLDQYNKYKK